MHLVDDFASGVSLHDSGAMQFFLAQALGIILEDCVTRLYHLLPLSMRLPNTAVKIVGFIWVEVYLIWSVPGYMYPMLWRANQGLNDSTIPYSLFGPDAQPLKAAGCILVAGIISLVG